MPYDSPHVYALYAYALYALLHALFHFFAYTQVTHQRISRRGDLARDHLYFWRDPACEILAHEPKLGKVF